MRTSTTANKWLRGLIIMSWLLIWQIAYVLVGKEVLLPSPFHTLKMLFVMVQERTFYLHILFTLRRVCLGVGISFIVAILTAVAGTLWHFVAVFIEPAVNFMKATPVMAITILALLWFKSDEVPIFVCFLMCYPIIYTNMSAGITNLDSKLSEMSRLYKVSLFTRITKCYMPQLGTYLRAALDLGTGMGFKVVIAAEVLSIPKYAMGYQLLDAKIYLETQEVFAWVLVIVLLSQLSSMGINQLFKMRKIK